MPIAKLQLPDGRIVSLEVEEGTTQEEILSFANEQFGLNQVEGSRTVTDPLKNSQLDAPNTMTATEAVMAAQEDEAKLNRHSNWDLFTSNIASGAKTLAQTGDKFNLGLLNTVAGIARSAEGDITTSDLYEEAWSRFKETKNPMHFLYVSFAEMNRLAGKALDSDKWHRRALNQKRYIDRVSRDIERSRKKSDGSNIQKLVEVLGQGATSIPAAVLTTVLTKNPTYAAGLFGVVQASDSYVDAIDAGKSHQEAFSLGVKSGAAESIIEMLGGTAILKTLFGHGVNSIARKIATSVVVEGGQEAIQQSMEELILTPIRQDESIGDKVARVVWSGIAGSILGGGTAGGVAMIKSIGKQAGLDKKHIKEIEKEFKANESTLDDAIAEEDATLSSDELIARTDKDSASAIDILDNGMDNPVNTDYMQDDIKIFLSKDKTKSEQGTIKIKGDIKAINKKLSLLRRKLSRRGVDVGQLNIQDALNAIRLVRTTRTTPVNKSLTQRIRKLGGINPKAPAAKIMKKAIKKLPARILSKTGTEHIDMILRDLWISGYYPEVANWKDLTLNHLIEGIQDEKAGNLRLAGEEVELAAAQESVDQALEFLGKAGLDLTDKETLTEIQSLKKKVSGLKNNLQDIKRKNEADSMVRKVKEYNITDDNIKEVLQVNRTRKDKIKEKAGDIFSDMHRMTGAALTPISTRLTNISPKLSKRLRKFEFDRSKQINEDIKAIQPFLAKWKELSKDDMIILDYAMKNGDKKIIDQIVKKADMEVEMQQLRDTLDRLYMRSRKQGFKVGYIKNFFPRIVSRPKELLKFYEESEAWSDIAKALKLKEEEMSRPLTIDEKAYMINTLLRGYKTSHIQLSKPDALKSRGIDFLTPKISQFYESTDQSILRYLTSVNDAVESRKFFGKGAATNEIESIQDSIGYFAMQELEKGNITPAQVSELSDIMKARFHKGKISPLVRVYKNFSYIDMMGSTIAAITQIGDLMSSLFKAGVYDSAVVLPSAVLGKSKVTRDDINVTNIAQEFEESSYSANAVSTIFKLTGLEKIDMIGKETLINASLRSFQRQARRNPNSLKQPLDIIFGEETDAVINDLKSGKISENVKLLLYNRLLDFQPVSLSEMPEFYLKSPNARILYMLKTFTIKQIDVYRREVFQEIRRGNVLQGLSNFVRLTFFLVLMNASADFIKDFMLGRDTEVEDVVVNNIMRIGGISPFQVYTFRREGAGKALISTIAPPFKFIDNVIKDGDKFVKQGKLDLDDMKSVESVPLVGKEYYWLYGAGADK